MKKIFLIVNPVVGIGLFTAGYFACKKLNKEKPLKTIGTIYVADSENGELGEVFFANMVPVSDFKKEKYTIVEVKNIKKAQAS